MHTYRPPSDSCGPEQTVTMNSSTKWTTTDTTAHFTEHLFISEKLEGRVVLVTLYYILTQVFPLTVSLAFLLKVFHRKNRKRIISSIHSALCSTLPGTSYNNPTQRKLEMCANDTAGTFSKTTSCILSNCQKSVPALLHRRKKKYIYIALIKKMPAAEKPGLYGNSTENTFTSCTLWWTKGVNYLKNVASCEQF